MASPRLAVLGLIALLAAAAIALSWPGEPALVEWTAADVEDTPRQTPGALEGISRRAAEPEEQAGENAREPLPDDPPARMLTLRGRVVDGFGAAVGGAQISIELREGGRDARVRPQATTDRDGRFALRGPLRGARSVGVLAAHPAFAPNLVDREVRADRADTVLVGDIVLGPGGSLHGTITDSAGAALAGATVELQSESNSRVMWSPLTRALFPAASTDAAGGYSFERVPAGLYRAHARAPRHLAASSASATVRPGDRLTLPPLALGPGCALTVVLRDERGAPIEAGNVTLTPVGQRGANRYLNTDARGRAEFDHLAPGIYEARVRAPRQLGRRELVEPCRTPEVTLQMATGLSVRGQVVDAAGRAVERYAVQARRVRELPGDVSSALAGLDRAALQARLEALQARAAQDLAAARELLDVEAALSAAAAPKARGQDWPDQVRAVPQPAGAPQAHPEGQFELTGLETGVYVVDVKAPGLRAVRTAEFELRADATAPTLQIALQPGLEVRGKVLTKHAQRPIAGARVEVMLLPPDARQSQQVRGASLGTAQTDARGEFSIEDLDSGNVAVRAWANGHAQATSPPFQLSANRDGLVVELEAHAGLRGVVRGVPEGREGDVMVVAMATARSVATRRADPDGSFAIQDLQAQVYRVRAYLGRSGDAVRRMNAGQPSAQEVVVQLAPGEQREVDLALTPVAQGGVRGRVRRNGEAGFGLHVSLRNGAQGAWGNGVSTEPDGSFVIGDVDVGDYELVVAVAQRERVELSSQPVRIEADREARVDVDLHTAVLEGEVVTRDGKPTGDGVLRWFFHRTSLPAEVESEAGVRYHSVAVRNGRFRADPLPAGEHYVEVRAPAPFLPAGEVVRLAPGEHRTVRLQAGPPRGSTDK